MVNQHRLDFIIVGQGLAGSLLAWHLIEAGQSVLVVDNASPSSASRVAAGLFNPVTGKRLVKEPGIEKYIASAHECYQQISAVFSQTFFHEKQILRLLDSEEVNSAWQKRHDDPTYKPFFDKVLEKSETGYQVDGFIQAQTGYLATTAILDAIRDWLSKKGAYMKIQLDYADLQTGEVIQWQAYSARCVIFCEGARIYQNPWFSHLPMQPSMGEILTLRTSEPLPKWIVNGGQWLLPLEDGVFKTGATYTWPKAGQHLVEETSDTGKQVLLKGLEKLVPTIKDYQVVAHEVGIRPNSLDKRPLIGFHPEHDSLAAFNGFGSRGSLLIPYYAQHFADVLLNGSKLDEDVDIKRCRGV